MKIKPFRAWAVVTRRGRVRGHIYRKKAHAVADHFPDWGDKLVKVQVRGS